MEEFIEIGERIYERIIKFLVSFERNILFDKNCFSLEISKSKTKLNLSKRINQIVYENKAIFEQRTKKRTKLIYCMFVLNLLCSHPQISRLTQPSDGACYK